MAQVKCQGLFTAVIDELRESFDQHCHTRRDHDGKENIMRLWAIAKDVRSLKGWKGEGQKS